MSDGYSKCNAMPLLTGNLFGTHWSYSEYSPFMCFATWTTIELPFPSCGTFKNLTGVWSWSYDWHLQHYRGARVIFGVSGQRHGKGKNLWNYRRTQEGRNKRLMCKKRRTILNKEIITPQIKKKQPPLFFKTVSCLFSGVGGLGWEWCHLLLGGAAQYTIWLHTQIFVLLRN